MGCSSARSIIVDDECKADATNTTVGDDYGVIVIDHSSIQRGLVPEEVRD